MEHDIMKPAGAGLDQASQRLAKMFAALSATNEAILRTKSPEQLYQQVCEAALSGGNFIAAAILLPEPATDLLKIVAGAGGALDRLRATSISVEPTSPLGQGLAGEAFRSGQPCISNDFLNDAHSSAWREEARAAGIGAAAALPLVRAGRSFGVLVVYLGEAGALDDGIVALLTRMAENVSFSLDNLDREAERKSSEKATRRLARMFAALSATNEAILRAKTADELYQLVCDAAVHGGKSLATIVLLADPDSSWLKPVAGTGAAVEMIKTTRFSTDPENPYGKGVCGTAFRSQKPCVNTDILSSEQARPWREPGRQTGVVACAALPLLKGGQSIGVLMFFISRSWAMDEEIIALLARMAANVSFALDNFEHEERRNRAEARARYLATHDNLTGLPNRGMFSQTLSDAIKVALRYHHDFSVMFIDLDRFKIINDTLGHAAGDLLLAEVATRLERCLRDSDVIARLGGDEFVVLLRQVSDGHQAAAVAQKLLSSVDKAIVIHGQKCRVTASIGIATFPADGEDEQTLIKNADAAMYLAKRAGRNNLRIFSRAIRAPASKARQPLPRIRARKTPKAR